MSSLLHCHKIDAVNNLPKDNVVIQKRATGIAVLIKK